MEFLVRVINFRKKVGARDLAYVVLSINKNGPWKMARRGWENPMYMLVGNESAHVGWRD